MSTRPQVFDRVPVARVGRCSAPARKPFWVDVCGAARPGHLGGGAFAPGVPCPGCGHTVVEQSLVNPSLGGLAQWPPDVHHSYLDATGTVTVMVDRDVTDTFDVRSEQGRAELARAGYDPAHVLAVLEETAPLRRTA